MKQWIEKYSVLLSLLLVLSIMGIIFYLSAQPAEASGAVSGGLTFSFLRAIFPGFEEMSLDEQQSLCQRVEHIIRKLAHFTEYGVLGFALMLHIQQIKKRIFVCMPWLWAWGIGALYAVSDELHQGFVPGRSPGVMDVLIDSFGVIAGVGALLLILWLIEKRKSKRGV